MRGKAAEILAKMKYRQVEKDIALLLKDSDKTVKKEAKEAIIILNALPPEPLRVHSLGEFRLSVGDRDMPAAEWKRKITKTALVQFSYFYSMLPVEF